MRDFTEEELKTLADVLPNIALQLRTSMATLYTAVDRLLPELLSDVPHHQQPDRCGASF